MLLNLKQLSPQNGDFKEFNYSYELPVGQLTHTQNDFSVKIFVAGNAQKKNGLIVLDFKVDFSMEFHCDRCFELVNKDFSFSFNHQMVEGKVDELDEGFALVRENTLDLDQLATSDVILEFPIKLLCDENCLGICAVCNGNKNQKQCDCKVTEIDPRLEALKQLLN